MRMNGKTRITTGDISTSTKGAPVKVQNESRENVVIIPTYNEAINLKLLVPSILRQGPFDVLIVDDNSPDGTGEIAEELASCLPGQVNVLHRPGKLGLGTAYLAGFEYALAMGYQRIFTMDADFSHDPSYLPELRAALDEADVVLGSRYVQGGGTLRWPLRRRLLSRGGSAYARLMLGLAIHDLTGGFKGFRHQVLEALMPELSTMRSTGYAFQIEMTYLCSRHGYRIVEIPIIFEDRLVGKSKMSQRIMMEALQVVWALRLSQGSAHTHRVAQRRAQLARQRVRVAAIALVFLLIFGAAVTLVPRKVSSLVQGVAVQQDSLRHAHLASSGKQRSSSSRGGEQPGLQHSTSLQLQGTNLTPNVPLHFVGSGFRSNEALKVTIQNQAREQQVQLTPTNANTVGQVNTTEAIPAQLAPGTYWLVVEGMSSHYKAQASFQLQWIQPMVQLDAYTVKPKHDFGFTGSGFLPGELVEVHLEMAGQVPTRVVSTVSANAGGNIRGHITMPMLPEGNYSLSFIGRQSQTATEVGLNIQGFHPWVVLDTYAPSLNTRLGFEGRDFAPGEEVLVYLNQRESKPVARLFADTTGRFVTQAIWQVPRLSGENTLIFVGQQSQAMTTTTFTVVP